MKAEWAMLATGASLEEIAALSRRPRDWITEPKLDGVRLALEYGHAFTRGGNDVTAGLRAHAGLAHDLATVPTCIIDCELVVVDEGKASFDQAMAVTRGQEVHGTIYLAAFDLLEVAGVNVRTDTFDRRYARLNTGLGNGLHLMHITNVPCENEGHVTKRRLSPYRAGRSSDWYKHKFTETVTCAVFGATPSTNSRPFHSLKLAMRDGDRLVEVGHVGGGFTEDELITAKAFLDAGEPFFVEVQIQGYTQHRHLRHPTFVRFRPDVDISGVNFIPTGETA